MPRASSDPIAVRPSRIHGLGAFATRALPRGRRLGRYGGPDLHPEAAACLVQRHGPPDQWPPYIFRLATMPDAYLDGSRVMHHWSVRMNSSRGVPSTRNNVRFLRSGSMVVTRPIAAGEELLVSYGRDFWRKRVSS